MGRQSMFLFLVKRPVALCMIGFLLGVALHSFFPLLQFSSGFWIILSSCLVIWLFVDWLFLHLPLSLHFFVAILLGLLRFDVTVPQKIIAQKTQSYSGIVHNVQDGNFGLQATIKAPLSKGVGGFLSLNLKYPIPIGSTVTFSCALRPLEQKDGELDRRYAANLHRAQAKCSPKDLRVTAPPSWWDMRQTFADLRDWTNKRIESSMPGDEGALMAGMLYGERGMGKASNDLFRRAGLTHLIAVSGSNITIVASIVFALLLGCGLWRRQAFWATSAALLAYVMFTGFSASVARAAVMGWLVLLSRHWGRASQTWYVLLLSATVLCIIDPWMLGYDAGFALSFLATIGLMIWSPVFSKRLKFFPEILGLREAAATTVGATCMTIPYMAFAFERVSLAGLLTNLVAVPLVPWAMLFGAVSAAWGDLPGHAIVSLPATGIARGIFSIASLADVFPRLNIPMQGMDLVLLAATYVALIVIWFLLREKREFSTGK